MTEPTCTCDGRQQFVCHDMRNEPHLVGCPRWGTPKRVPMHNPECDTCTYAWCCGNCYCCGPYDQGGNLPPGLTRITNKTGEAEAVEP